ncbi:hypothetical protein N9524_01360 [Flavobacteriaceae bacterium]|nr:hypothetical protein [Flavobacteriaceae bacterium]MDB4108091.1 hypothetical protein [Flavobacteriaceae bacterium]MDB4108094.1 hypothetical protein [Flavobacteriaceae bacterium]MDB4183293.1 hypothetical protein [Flavobacteriaceae bacterium]MDC0118164.1 hypothetical protein [bacterium]
MKKLLLLSAFLTFACSSDDSDSSNSNGNSINPPAWIQGVWINNTSSVFDFRTDDICLTAGTITSCNKAYMALSSESSAYEEISDTRYYVVISFAGVMESTYEFEKVSDSTINWILYPSGTISTFTKN